MFRKFFTKLRHKKKRAGMPNEFELEQLIRFRNKASELLVVLPQNSPGLGILWNYNVIVYPRMGYPLERLEDALALTWFEMEWPSGKTKLISDKEIKNFLTDLKRCIT